MVVVEARMSREKKASVASWTVFVQPETRAKDVKTFLYVITQSHSREAREFAPFAYTAIDTGNNYHTSHTQSVANKNNAIVSSTREEDGYMLLHYDA